MSTEAIRQPVPGEYIAVGKTAIATAPGDAIGADHAYTASASARNHIENTPLGASSGFANVATTTKSAWDYYIEQANGVDEDLVKAWNADLDNLLLVASIHPSAYSMQYLGHS